MPTLIPVEKREPRLVPADPEQDKKIREAMFYSEQFGIVPDKAYDLSPQLNQQVFGKHPLPAQPGKMFFDAFMQSMADKPAMMLKGVTAYTPGKAAGIDPMLDKVGLYLESLKDPKVTERVQTAARGKLWPVGDERQWWQVELQYVPEVINAWAVNIGDQIPIMLITQAGRMAGKAVGTAIAGPAGVGTAVATGGPDPSDVATAPAVMAVTREVMKHLGGAGPLVAMETGGFLDEAANYEIDADIAEKYARIYGPSSGAIEYAQQLWILGRYSKINKIMQEKILTRVLKEIGGTAVEGLEEMSQGGLQRWLLGKAVAEMKKRHPEYDKEPPKITEGMKREGIIGAGVAAITRLPGHGMSLADGAVARMREVKPETKKFLGEPSTQELEQAAAQPVEKPPSVTAAGQTAETGAVEPISAPSEPSAKITPISESKTGVEIPEVVEQVPIEEEETPEEAKVAEAKLEVEAAEEVEPELYIGNVTPGMKTRIAEGQGVKAEDVKGFTKEGFPTKRTKIKMTRGEAEQYLDWLENDLQERLDKNKINTRNQMAWANADWGDIKNLRTMLGQEVGNRPFTIFYDQQHEIVEIKPTGKRIAGAVQPSTLQESKMTVQEVLRAVMKRSARYAKMAYAKGRTELRAELRAKSRARARLKKARAIIKTQPPRSIDILHRGAIEAIRKSIDPWFSRKKEAQFEVVEKEGKITGARRVLAIDQYLKDHPEFAEYIPVEVIRRLKTKSYQEYTIEELEQISTAIEILKDMGGLRRKMEVSQYEAGKQKDLSELKKTSVPMTDREMVKPEKIGETLLFKERAKNTLSRALNWAAQKKRSLAGPMDVFFDLLDDVKEYAGANYRIFKETIDRGWSRYLNTRDELVRPVIELANELGLKEGNFERIGVYAALQQDRGRQKLLDSGFTEEQIDEVKLTADEMQLYDMMREKLDELTPDIEDVMHNVYNEAFQKVKNYFSFMTDFESMSDYEIREMYGDRVVEFSSALRKNVGKGFTITRTGGKQRIKIDAMQVFAQHIDNASYLIELGADIKRLGEIAATKEYGEMVGERGQEEVRSWIDLMARKGRAQQNKTIPVLDVFRKHTGAAIIGFKLSSALVNVTPLLDGAGMIGRYAFQGASDIATNKNWRQFLMKNLPELRDRVGGDIEFTEFGATALEKLEKIGFWPLQKIDGLAASSIAAGAYQKYLDEHNLKMDFENPNEEAITYAQRILRRSQSSAFFKDLPSVFTRGTFTGNNSLDRLLVQFQSFMLNRWSLIEHDMIRQGISTRNIGQAMNMFFWLVMAGFAEMGLRRLSKELIALLTGEDLDDWSETFTKEIVVNTLQNVPVISQGVGLYNYGNIPVPTLSLAQDITEKIQILKRTKDPNKKMLKALELLVLITGTTMGAPGTMQVSEIIRSAGKEPKKTQQRGGF